MKTMSPVARRLLLPLALMSCTALAETPRPPGAVAAIDVARVEPAKVTRIDAGPERRRENCPSALSAALGRDIQAAQALAEKMPWADIEKLFAEAEQAWAEAASGCVGATRDQALANQADARRARDHAAGQAGESAACEQAVVTANRIMEFSRQPWTEKRWDEAARWLRKADLAWESAAGQCAGGKREQAARKRDSARIDAHNATACAPLWDQATTSTTRLKAELATLGAAEKTERRDQIERLWTEAASSCKGASTERAAATAALMVKERGSRPLSAIAAAPVTAAPHAAVPSAAADSARIRVADVIYTGQFRPNANGEMEGRGRVEWDSGDVFEGSLVKGRAEGKGVFIWKSGQRYQGDLVQGRPAGQGKLQYADTGDSYEGGFAEGLPDGRGSYTWKNGDSYRGDWAKGQKHGHGRYSSAKGGYWEGEYANDERVKGIAALSRAPD